MEMTTQQAMEQLLTEKAAWKRLGYTQNTWWSLRARYQKGELSYDKIYEVLERAGYRVVKEREWENDNAR